MTTRANGGPADRDRLRIHFYVNYSHLGGTYFRFHNLAVGLTQLGHRVTVYACDFDRASLNRTEIRDGVPYVIRPEHWLTRLCWHACDPVTVIRRWASPCPPCDVAHLFQPFPGAAAPWLRATTRVRIYDWDDLWSGGLMSGPVGACREHWPRMLVRILERRLPRWADHVTAISRVLADLAWDRGARAVTVLHSGSWPADTPDKAATRARLGLRTDRALRRVHGPDDGRTTMVLRCSCQERRPVPGAALALCGMPASELDGLPPTIRRRTDYLGQLTPAAAKDFAACLDLALPADAGKQI